MKQKLFLKFYSGPKIGLLSSNRESLTAEPSEGADQIARNLRKSGVPASVATIRIKFRTFGSNGLFADGIFDDQRGTFGYFLYAPKNSKEENINGLLFSCLNHVPFFRAYESGSTDALFETDVLPSYPDLPPSHTAFWNLDLQRN